LTVLSRLAEARMPSNVFQTCVQCRNKASFYLEGLVPFFGSAGSTPVSGTMVDKDLRQFDASPIFMPNMVC
jgi:hypothetical protein